MGAHTNVAPMQCACPVDGFQQMISGKYKLRLIWDLQHGPRRYGELKNSLGTLGRGSSITARVLSRELKSLASSGLIERRDLHMVPPHVEYSLSPLGRSLLPVIATMQAWGMDHLVGRPIAV